MSKIVSAINNLEKRYQSHINGTSGCKYMRSYKPIRIAQSWEIIDGKCWAMKVERYIKLSRSDKLPILFFTVLLHITSPLVRRWYWKYT